MQFFKAGNIDVGYENGFLRYFKTGDTEVLRMIYFAVRNANWENLEPVISDEVIASDDTSFHIQFTASYFDQNELIFTWEVVIEGLAYNEIRFEINGNALKDFRTNRAGFCLLHPVEHIAGQPVTVFHPDNREKVYEFPKQIAPHQPFIDITAMQWKVGDNEFRLEMSGDLFEIEDQRNWGDASYKTYCTPLRIPFPKQIRTGDTISQKVIFKASLAGSVPVEPEMKSKKKGKGLTIGIGMSESISEAAIERLKQIKWHHYRVEIDLSEDWQSILKQQMHYGRQLNAGLEIAVTTGANYVQELGELTKWIKKNTVPVTSLILLSRNELVTIQAVIDHIPELKAKLGKTHVGIGTQFNFTEINRFRFNPGLADFIALSFDPQEHASDDLTIMENVVTPKYMIESIEALYGKPAHFSPLLLKRRFNPYATDANEVKLPLEKQTDPRQKTQLASDWVALVLKNLEETSGISVTFFQATGDLGIVDEEGNAYPVFNQIRSYVAGNQ